MPSTHLKDSITLKMVNSNLPFIFSRKPTWPFCRQVLCILSGAAIYDLAQKLDVLLWALQRIMRKKRQAGNICAFVRTCQVHSESKWPCSVTVLRIYPCELTLNLSYIYKFKCTFNLLNLLPFLLSLCMMTLSIDPQRKYLFLKRLSETLLYF